MLKQLIAASVLLTLTTSGAIAAIYTCTDASGRKHTADRPIAACLGQEHRVLNADGTTKTVVPAAMSAHERLAADKRDREAERERIAHEDAIQRDRLLLRRYPSPEAHAVARVEALAAVRTAVDSSERRIAQIETERKRLRDEASFHEGQPLPAKLKQKLDASEAMLKAQQTLVQNQSVENARINSRFDAEKGRLEPLWKGAAPGSMAMAAQAPARR